MTRILRLPAVMERVGLARSTIYLRMKDAQGAFPRPVQLGSPFVVGWYEDEVDEWLKNRIRTTTIRPLPPAA